MYTHFAVHTLLSTTQISTIQYYLVILHFLIKWLSLQDFKPGTSIPIEQVTRQLFTQIANYQTTPVHVTTFFIPIQHVYVPTTRVEFHYAPLLWIPLNMQRAHQRVGACCAPKFHLFLFSSPSYRLLFNPFLSIQFLFSFLDFPFFSSFIYFLNFP